MVRVSYGFAMRKEFKTSRILILAVSALTAFCLAYPQNDNWAEIRSLSRSLTLESLETADQDDPVLDPPDQPKGILSTSYANLGQPGVGPFPNPSPFPSQPFSLEQTFSILRC